MAGYLSVHTLTEGAPNKWTYLHTYYTAAAVCTAVGVTNRINQDQLLAFASGRQYVMKIQSFSELPTTLETAVHAMRSMCRRGNRVILDLMLQLSVYML